MSTLPLTLACLDYDRTRALQDGRVRPEGIDLRFLDLPVEETFYRMLRHREFDVSEMSLSSFVLTLNEEWPPFIGIPVFPSRYFRHQSIFVSNKGRVRDVRDMAGSRVGIPEYQMTAAVWQRGILAEHHNIPVNSVRYFTGGLEQPGRPEKLQLDIPSNTSVTPIGPEETLSEKLVLGELDAVYSASEPSCFDQGRNVRRLFENYENVEAAYYRDTGIFPIMHLIVIRREVHEKWPWVAGSLTKAFEASLEVAYSDLHYRSALKTMLPWLAAHVSQTERSLGKFYWTYGLKANHHVLDKFLEYSHDQGLAKRRWKPEDLFYAGSSDTYRL